MNNTNLNNKLWSMADSLRGNMDAGEFKNYILGIMFYKFISDKVERFYKEELSADEITLEEAFNNLEYKEDLIEDAQDQLGYALSIEHLFSTLIQKIKDDDFSNELLENAFAFFNDNVTSNEDFSNLFDDVRLNDSRLGSTQGTKNANIAKLMTQLQEIEDEEGAFDSDILGDAYEYLIAQFASNGGKKAGEFYTPQSVAKLLSTIVTSQKTKVKDIYDPACGSGSLLIRVAKELKTYGTINGQELNNTTYNLARMNMIIHGINYNDFSIKVGDTIKEPNPDLLDKKYDAIVANPPYGVKWDSPKDLLNDDRFYKYGAIAPKGAMETSFVQHIEFSLSEKGTAAILLPVGVLFRTGAENKILAKLIEDEILESVVLLPSNMFTSTSIPVVCLILKKCKTNSGVFLIDATDLTLKENKKNVLLDAHIEEIMKLYTNKEETQISKMIDIETIRKNKYNLNITRYIQRVVEEEIDIDQLGKDIKTNLIKLRELEENIEKDIELIKDLLK